MLTARAFRDWVIPGILLLCAAPNLDAQSKLRIAVLGFENNSSGHIFGDRLGDAAADELTTQLVKSGAFTVIERRQIQSILSEQSLGMSGAVDAATAAKVGKLLGAQLVVVGSITQFSLEQTGGAIGKLNIGATVARAETKVDARLVNVNTGEILIVAEGEGKKTFGGGKYKDMNLQRDFNAGVAQEALRPAIEKTVKLLVEQKGELKAVGPATPTMTVVGVRAGGEIYIDRGENAGLSVGQRLTVMRVKDVIKDARGNVLDEVLDKVAVLEITKVLGQSSICKVVEGAGIKQGDRVSL